MDARFKTHTDSLHASFEQITSMQSVTAIKLPRDMPAKGIYLFSEGSAFLYVGRSNRLRSRLLEHGRTSSSHNSAPFAFTLAREQISKLLSINNGLGTRKSLESNDIFGMAFNAAKQRVRGMDIRYVREDDPTRQALLEMYVAVVLETPYNDFDNH